VPHPGILWEEGFRPPPEEEKDDGGDLTKPSSRQSNDIKVFDIEESAVQK
jgi:hypothetical protein